MPTFLPKKSKSLYTRIFIPKDLRDYFRERVEVWRSLRTVDHDEALYRSLKLKFQAKQLFRTLSQHGEHMTKDQIEALVSNWLESELEDFEEWRNTYGPISQNVRDNAPVFLEADLDEAKEVLAANNFRVIEKEADDLLKSAGLTVLDHESAEYGRLCRRLLRAKMEYAKIQIDRWNGEYHDNHFNKPAINPHRPEGTKASPPASPLFSVVLEKFLAASQRPVRTAKPLKAERFNLYQTYLQCWQRYTLTRPKGPTQ